MSQENKNCSNSHPCECPSTTCKRHGKCCDCVAFHKSRGNLPQCLRGIKK